MKVILTPGEIENAVITAGSVIKQILSRPAQGGPQGGPRPRKPEQVELILDMIVAATAAHEKSALIARAENERQETSGPEIHVHIMKVGDRG